MIQKIIDKLMGQAGDGNRKMAFGTLVVLLLFVFLMWAPDITPETRRTGLSILAGVVVVVIGGNAVEHREKAKVAIAKMKEVVG